MGFFSWRTQDSDRSIANKYNEERNTFKVFMRDNKDNVWVEEDYNGYGVFGGKDYYQLLAEMNELDGLTGNVDKDRYLGITLAFSNEAYISPCLFEYEHSEWYNMHPEDCEAQGFFY